MSKCGPPKEGRAERGGEAGRQTEGQTTKEILIRAEKTRLRHAGRTRAGIDPPSLVCTLGALRLVLRKEMPSIIVDENHFA